eukprot:scaffold119318_cov42-Cyclotella_meneghiniana.AAC.6
MPIWVGGMKCLSKRWRTGINEILGRDMGWNAGPNGGWSDGVNCRLRCRRRDKILVGKFLCRAVIKKNCVN